MTMRAVASSCTCPRHTVGVAPFDRIYMHDAALDKPVTSPYVPGRTSVAMAGHHGAIAIVARRRLGRHVQPGPTPASTRASLAVRECRGSRFGRGDVEVAEQDDALTVVDRAVRAVMELLEPGVERDRIDAGRGAKRSSKVTIAMAPAATATSVDARRRDEQSPGG